MPVWDAELARLNNSARAAYNREALETAATLYEQALTRARALDTALAIGNAAYNLAICRLAQGENEKASHLLREAEIELIRAQAGLADVLLVKAKLAQLQGRHDDARRLIQRLLSDPASAPAASHRVEAALVRGQLACDDGETARARAELDEATRQGAALSEPVLQAAGENLAGRINLLEKKPAEAAGHFDRESVLYQEARQPRELAAALRRAGEAWREASQPGLAAERFFRAARCSFAQGDPVEAVRCVELSLSLAAAARDDALQQRVLQLQAEITTVARGVKPEVPTPK